MIIQHVLKGIGGIDDAQAQKILDVGITCNWWRKVQTLPQAEVAERLTRRNLFWHQNNYDIPDPLEGGEEFRLHTPFISTTAGTVERDAVRSRNVIHTALQVALDFATDGWSHDGYVFYCYIFVLGRPAVSHQFISEELRELNVYTSFSPFQPEGEITAKIIIPTVQIEKYEYYALTDIHAAWNSGSPITPTKTVYNNKHFVPPTEVTNVRMFLRSP